jgi:hypothetical protein
VSHRLLPPCSTIAISTVRLRLVLLHGCRHAGSNRVDHRPPSLSSSRSESTTFLSVPSNDGAPIWVTSPGTRFSPPRPSLLPQPCARCCSSSSASARSSTSAALPCLTPNRWGWQQSANHPAHRGMAAASCHGRLLSPPPGMVALSPPPPLVVCLGGT